jgi:hypothetical protein
MGILKVNDQPDAAQSEQNHNSAKFHYQSSGQPKEFSHPVKSNQSSVTPPRSWVRRRFPSVLRKIRPWISNASDPSRSQDDSQSCSQDIVMSLNDILQGSRYKTSQAVPVSLFETRTQFALGSTMPTSRHLRERDTLTQTSQNLRSFPAMPRPQNEPVARRKQSGSRMRLSRTPLGTSTPARGVFPIRSRP